MAHKSNLFKIEHHKNHSAYDIKKEKKRKKNTTGSIRSGCEFPKHYENVCFFYVMMYRRKPLQKVLRQSYFSAKIPKLQQFIS